jgi:hypothetical protein
MIFSFRLNYGRFFVDRFLQYPHQLFINLKHFIMVLLRAENDIYILYFFLGIAALVLWFSILRWAVRSNNIIRNQKAIIYLMKNQYIKQGATAEEIKAVEAEIEKIMEG